MSDYTLQEIDRLHRKLRSIYSLGRLTPQEEIEVRGLWARIERLESAHAAQVAREAKFNEAN